MGWVVLVFIALGAITLFELLRSPYKSWDELAQENLVFGVIILIVILVAYGLTR